MSGAHARFIAGVDPGLSGAIGLYDPVTQEARVFAMPTHVIKVNGKNRRNLDLASLAQWLDFNASTIERAIIEDVHAMPKQGVSSSFAFGRAFGVIEGVLAANFVPTRYVSPAVWKRALGLTGDKDMSRRLASRLLPSHCKLWPLAKDDGKAESVLLAIYGSKTP